MGGGASVQYRVFISILEFYLPDIRFQVCVTPVVSGNENTAYQNIWNLAKAVLKRKFLALFISEKKKSLKDFFSMI